MTFDLREVTLAIFLSPQVRCTSPWGRMCLRAAAWALEPTADVLPTVPWGCATVPTCGGPQMGPTLGITGALAPWGGREALPCRAVAIPRPQRRRTPSFLQSHTSMCEFTLVSSALSTKRRANVLSLACNTNSLYHQHKKYLLPLATMNPDLIYLPRFWDLNLHFDVNVYHMKVHWIPCFLRTCRAGLFRYKAILKILLVLKKDWPRSWRKTYSVEKNNV